MQAIKNKKTKVVPVFEDEPFENDRIQCPKCHCVQDAKIYPERKVNKKLHRCWCCKYVIHKRDWKSLKPA